MLADELGPTLQALRPGARALGPALRQTRPFLRETTPIIRDEIRPFVRASRPLVTELRPAVRDLSALTPDLLRTLQRRQRRCSTRSPTTRPATTEEGFLFWASWVNHLGPAVFSTQDGHGPIRRGLVVVRLPEPRSCSRTSCAATRSSACSCSCSRRRTDADVCPSAAQQPGSRGGAG